MGQENSVVSDDTPPNTLVERSPAGLAEYIKSGQAKRIVVMIGAGISTAAGIPDFRSPNTGIYANLARLNLPNPEAVFDINYFRHDPEPFYVLAKELYPGKFHPTISHVFIALLASKGLLLHLFTQNIDCLERAAGVPPELIVEAHGSFATQRCIDCGTAYPDELMKEHVSKGEVPRCIRTMDVDEGCDGLVKPDIVFFGESLPPSFRERSYLAAVADLALVMGTSLQVHPFAGLPGSVRVNVPRALFNLERVGNLGTQADDVLFLGDCDAGVRQLADELGWREELEEKWRGIVGDEEAERQLRSVSKREAAVEEEVTKLAEEIEEVLHLGADSNNADEAKEGGQTDEGHEAKRDAQTKTEPQTENRDTGQAPEREAGEANTEPLSTPNTGSTPATEPEPDSSGPRLVDGESRVQGQNHPTSNI